METKKTTRYRGEGEGRTKVLILVRAQVQKRVFKNGHNKKSYCYGESKKNEKKIRLYEAILSKIITVFKKKTNMV